MSQVIIYFMRNYYSSIITNLKTLDTQILQSV